MKRELKELIQSNEARSFDPKVILINDIKERRINRINELKGVKKFSFLHSL